MSKIDLTDVTFTIPVYYDSPDRVENLNIVIDYILSKFNTNILVYEEALDKPHFSYVVGRGVKYKSFPLVNKPYTHRTKLLNYMCLDATTPICVNYDADVILDVDQYTDSANLIREGKADFVYPYGGFVKKPREVIPLFKNSNYNLGDFKKVKDSHPVIESWGGALFYNKNSFIEAGMENERFISWGYEDWERRDRIYKLGYNIIRLDKPIYHLDHKITINSDFNQPLYLKNEHEFLKVKNMDKDTLTNYIKSWKK
jgi:hypothetical protein